MLLPELAADEGAAERIEQLAGQLLEAEAIIVDQGQRLERLKEALACEEGWRRRIWDEKETLKRLVPAQDKANRAGAELEQTLRDENAAVQAELGVFADRGNWIASEDGNYHYSVTWCGESDAPWNIARKALGLEEIDAAT